MGGSPSFRIPQRPNRTYPFSGGVEYEGGSTFILTPVDTVDTAALTTLLETVLQTGPYRYGDFFNLPMPVYLLKDVETNDVFRIAVRDGTIRFHVLPNTDSRGLRRMYERLVEASDTEWNVACKTDEPS